MFLFATISSSPVPKPTPAQLEYQQHEIVALIHFNMATFAKNGDPGCSKDNWLVKAPRAAGPTSDPATFNPTGLNTSQWAEVMVDLGVKHSILTAKHGCGFDLWPTAFKFSDGDPYGYDAGTFGRDVLGEYSAAMKAHGIGHGFYYSLTNNFYLNVYHHNVQPVSTLLPKQRNVTQAEFEAMALFQVNEIWSNYGSLSEIWFDGGYTSDMKKNLTALLARLQPNASTFEGLGVGPSPVCWVGTETGLPGGEIWSTGASQRGDPESSVFCPKCCDTTLQTGDAWFYEEGQGLRTLSEMIEVYHSTVGMNGVMELDFAIDRNGLVHPAHADLYRALGGWVRQCYGSPVAQIVQRGGNIVLPATSSGAPVLVDRVTIEENLAEGQLIRNFTVRVQEDKAGEWAVVGGGESIGNKRIVVFSSPVEAVAVQVIVDDYVELPLVTLKLHTPCDNA